MSVDILGTSCDQCRSTVPYIFTSTETRRLVRTDSPGQPPRLSHSSRTMKWKQSPPTSCLLYVVKFSQLTFVSCFLHVVLFSRCAFVSSKSSWTGSRHPLYLYEQQVFLNGQSSSALSLWVIGPLERAVFYTFCSTSVFLWVTNLLEQDMIMSSKSSWTGSLLHFLFNQVYFYG